MNEWVKGPIRGWTLLWNGARMSRYENGQRLPEDDEVVIGGQVTLIGGTVTPCVWGLHGSERLLDALCYSPCPNPVIAYCQFGGEIKRDGDKVAARSRTVLWALSDAESDAVLRAHARWSALTVHHLWKPTEVVTQYLITGDETLRTAVRAAVMAAGIRGGRAPLSDGPRAAAMAAAGDHAGSAAMAASWSAVAALCEAAASGMNRVPIWDDTWANAWAVSNAEIERLAWAAHNARADGLAWAPTGSELFAMILGKSGEGTGG